MKYTALGETGMKVSNISYGASALGSVFRETDDAESAKVVHRVLESGINYIDVAPWYGHGKAEKVLGKALAGIPRESYYLTTKVCRYDPEPSEMFDFSAERTIRSVEESLERLQLDYIDVIQVHDMEFAPNLDIIINETLPALQKVKESGKARFIGITGYPLENFRYVLERSPVKIDTILTYCHGSLNDNSLQQYIPYFQEKGVGIVNASPISMGLLTNRGPPKWHPATDRIKETCKQAAEYCQSKDVDISTLALQFSLEQPGVHTTLFSTASLANLERNLETAQSSLSGSQRETLQEVMDRYMLPLKNLTWEGVEVNRYRQALANPNASAPLLG